jgi:hypothetical protein
VNVPRQREEIIRFIHHDALEPSLKQMAMTRMAPVEENRVRSEKAAHEFGKGGMLGAFQKQVKMIGHQAPGMNAKWKEAYLDIFKELGWPCVLNARSSSLS